MIAKEEPGPWVESWLSRPRFAVYLAAVADRRVALDLYEWNAALSAGFLRDDKSEARDKLSGRDRRWFESGAQ
jgi:hypothetical protein